MDAKHKRRRTLDDWSVIRRILPAGWEEQARSLGALRRARAVPSPQVLLRLLLLHLADGCSLAETALRAKLAGWCDVTAAAVFARLQSSEHWLRWMSEQLWLRSRALPRRKSERRFLAVDATVVCESGRTGSQWRVHYAFNVSNLRCEQIELTDLSGGETFRRIKLRKGDVATGDRIYATPPGVEHAHRSGAEVLVRLNPGILPLFTRDGARIHVLRRMKKLRTGRATGWRAYVHGPSGGVIPGRLVAIKKSARAARAARDRLRKRATKKGKTIGARALAAAGYVMLFTTLPESEFSARRVLNWYRLRWQIELVFKRMKSIMGLGQLPKHAPASCRAWLHGKLFVTLLVERLIAEAESFPPWGYPLRATSEPVERMPLHVP